MNTTMNKDFAGRAALITGSGVGIGREVAQLLASRGAFVGVHYRSSEDDARETLRGIEAAGGQGVLVAGDIADEDQANAIVDNFVAAAGRLDVLVNNAGEPIDRATIEACSTDLWRRVIDTNLTGTFFITRRAIPHLKATGNGAIINNLSLSVQTGGANGAGAYAAAKGGIQVMTRTLAKELAPDVRTNAVMPGVIETRHHELFTSSERMAEYRQQTPMGRNGEAKEVAATIAFLASDDASFLNGALLDINGGRFLR
jgi:3-oxoacyl-[acyl-carrier protein] reductase